MDWFIIIMVLCGGILLLIFSIRSRINRNKYETAIKSKDWQNNLRYSLNHFPVNGYISAILLIMFAFLLLYLKFKK